MAATVGTKTFWSSSSFGALPSQSVTIDANCAVYLVVVHSLSNNVLPAGMKIGSTVMTQLYTHTGSGLRKTFYGLENPPTGSQTISPSAGTSDDWYGVGGYNIVGSDVSSSGGYVTSSNGSTGASVALSYTGTGLIFNGLSANTGAYSGPTNGETSGYNTATTGDATRLFAGAYIYEASGSSFTTGWNGAASQQSIGAIFVKDGAGRTPSKNGNFLLFM